MSDDDKDGKADAAARRHSWGTTLVTLVGGAILGIVGTLLTANVSNQFAVNQFWREQRLAAYTDYMKSLQALQQAVSEVEGRMSFFGHFFHSLPHAECLLVRNTSRSFSR